MSKILRVFSVILFFSFFLVLSPKVTAESKPTDCAISIDSPNLVKPTPGGPELQSLDVFPPHGPMCLRYKYRVIYKDKAGRPPKYVKLFHNCETFEMKKADKSDPEYKGDDYKKGVLYYYDFVPDSTRENFYYYYASNGIGVSRAAIIDSPNNGPMIFPDELKKAKIALFSKEKNTPLWEFDTGGDWTAKISMSADGNKIFARTSDAAYYFDKNSNQPLWRYPKESSSRSYNFNYETSGALSTDGNYAAIIDDGKLLLFDAKGNVLWQAALNESAISVALSVDGEDIAVGGFKNLFLFKKGSNKPIWKHEMPDNSNVHWVAITPDGEWISATTGCPDRRAYIFNKDSNQPYFRSEQITRDAPVWATAISDDGKTVAFSSDNEQGKTVVFLVDRESKKILWQYAGPNDNNSRTINISRDGQKIIAGGKGNFYYFQAASGTPVWTFQPASGRRLYASAMSADGQNFVAGSSDSNLYFFNADSNQPKWSANLGSWVNALAMSADGNYFVAGTGAANYVFDNDPGTSVETTTCSQVSEPPKMETRGGDGNDSGQPVDNGAKNERKKIDLPLEIIIGGLIIIAGLTTFFVWFFRRRKNKL